MIKKWIPISIQNSVPQTCLNSKTLSELSKPFFELNNVSSQTQNRGIRWFLWELKLKISVCGHRTTSGSFESRKRTSFVFTTLLQFVWNEPGVILCPQTEVLSFNPHKNQRIPRFWVCDETLWSSKKSLESSESVFEFRNVCGTEFWIDIGIHFFMMINNFP